jgi:hypothetical protein
MELDWSLLKMGNLTKEQLMGILKKRTQHGLDYIYTILTHKKALKMQYVVFH